MGAAVITQKPQSPLAPALHQYCFQSTPELLAEAAAGLLSPSPMFNSNSRLCAGFINLVLIPVRSWRPIRLSNEDTFMAIFPVIIESGYRRFWKLQPISSLLQGVIADVLLLTNSVTLFLRLWLMFHLQFIPVMTWLAKEQQKLVRKMAAVRSRHRHFTMQSSISAS